MHTNKVITITVIVITLAVVLFARLVWNVHVCWDLGRLEDVKVIIVAAALDAGVPDQDAIWRSFCVHPSKVHRSRSAPSPVGEDRDRPTRRCSRLARG
jgi:hypothetical protein